MKIYIAVPEFNRPGIAYDRVVSNYERIISNMLDGVEFTEPEDGDAPTIVQRTAMLLEADVAVFTEGYEQDSMCKILRDTAKLYGIPTTDYMQMDAQLPRMFPDNVKQRETASEEDVQAMVEERAEELAQAKLEAMLDERVEALVAERLQASLEAASLSGSVADVQPVVDKGALL